MNSSRQRGLTPVVNSGVVPVGHPAGEIVTSSHTHVGARASVLAGLPTGGVAGAMYADPFTTVSVGRTA
ncbi:MAG: hypothetical protein HY241_13000 [Actinobacteria bacterium]|nr:hypothetical protein [Actinomycetota bacterium]